MRLSNSKIMDINQYNKLDKFDEEYIIFINENMIYVDKALKSLINYDFITASSTIHIILVNINTLVHNSEFWKKLNDDKLLRNLACTVIEFIRIISILYKPFLPELMSNTHSYLGLNKDIQNYRNCYFNFKYNEQYFELQDELKDSIFIAKEKKILNNKIKNN